MNCHDFYKQLIRLQSLISLKPKIVIALLMIGSVNGATGDRDVSFGQSGSIITQLSTGNDDARSILLEQDGSIVIAGHTFSNGNTNSALVRYHSNGTLDTGFGTDGIVITPISVQANMFHAITHHNPGTFIAAGRAMIDDVFYGAVARYKTDGSLDGSFGKEGMVIDQKMSTINALAVYAKGVLAGKFIAAGETILHAFCSTSTLTRYNRDGSIDTTFGHQGIVSTIFGPTRNRATCVALQPDNKILVAGGTTYQNTWEHIVIARYHANGILDETFGTHGQVITDFGLDSFVNAIVLQPDGKILVAGATSISETDYDFALVRYYPNGILDKSFTDGISGQGKVHTHFGNGFNFIHAIALQADGKIIAAGQANMETSVFALARYHHDGTIDHSFGNNGKVISDLNNQSDIAYALALQKDGTIIAAGTTFVSSRGMDIALTRYTNDISHSKTQKSMERKNTRPIKNIIFTKKPKTILYTIRKSRTQARPTHMYATRSRQKHRIR